MNLATVPGSLGEGRWNGNSTFDLRDAAGS